MASTRNWASVTAAPPCRARSDETSWDKTLTMDLHPYAKELAARLGPGGKRQVSLKARTLLKGFGYYRRTETIVREIQAQLGALNLECDFSLTYPAELDERIEIRRTQKGVLPPPIPIRDDEADLLGKSVAATVEVFS